MPAEVAPAAAPAPAPAAAPAAPVVAPAAVPAAAPAAPAAAPAGAAPPADPGNLVAGAKAAEATPPTLDAVKAFLTEKGAKPEELAALDEAGLRAKYAEAQKPAGEKTTAPKAEDFAVKAPEGVTVDEVAVKAFQETLADANLSPAERAQRLFDQHQAALKAATEAQVQLWQKTQPEWVAAVKADAELGGANFDTMQSTIAKAIDSIGGAEAQKMRDAFIFTGAGNQPEIVRLMYRMGKALTEGGAILGDTPAKLGEKADAALIALYPSAAKAR